MTYRYSGKQSALAELERLNAAKEEARRQRIERRDLLTTIRREQKRLEVIQAETKVLDDEIRHLTTRAAELPPPRYGGREGLRAATEEAEAHERRKRNFERMDVAA